ncbi:MAG: GntR family transcriptional regulator [Phycisphaerales bacterium JB040]
MSSDFKPSPIAAAPGRPLYEAVSESVRSAIDEGRIEPGDQLPSTRELSEHMGVSLVTVHRALQDLVGRGVLRRGQGRGTFVHEDYLNPTRVLADVRCGVVLHDESSIADSYHGQVLEGVRRGGIELGVDLVLLRYGEDWRKECDGFIYVNPYASQLDRSPREWIKSKTGSSFPPAVVVGARAERIDVTCVDTDNVGIGRAAVEHLLDRGHRSLAFVGGGSELSNNTDRLHGFTEACESSGVSEDRRHTILQPGWKCQEDGHLRLREMLESSDRPTAVFAAGYYFALDVYRAASGAGLRVGEDLAVVGVDDPPSAALLSPSLTTMRQPLQQIGYASVRALLARLRDPGVSGSQHSFFNAELITRESTGGAPNAPGD